MKQMWDGIPLFNKFLLITCILIFVLTCLPLGVGFWLALAPYFLESFQVWRLVTGTFVHSDFLGLLFSLISYVPQAVMDEQQLGTVPFALRFFVLSTFINLFYGVFGIALG